MTAWHYTEVIETYDVMTPFPLAFPVGTVLIECRVNSYAEVEISATRCIRHAEPRLVICTIINRMALPADKKTRTRFAAAAIFAVPDHMRTDTAAYKYSGSIWMAPHITS